MIAPYQTNRMCRLAASKTVAPGAKVVAHSMEEMTELKWITIQLGEREFPF